MPLSKGSITGRSAYSDGGLGLSIGSRVGGSRHAIARRAPDSIKIGNNSGLSFVVNDDVDITMSGNIAYSINLDGENTTGFFFANYDTGVNGRKYSLFQNQERVAITISNLGGRGEDGIEAYYLSVSSFATNVTSNSFEIRFPTISGINDLTSDIIQRGLLYYELSGNELVYNSALTENALFEADKFTVGFLCKSDTAALETVKNDLTGSSNSVVKFQLNTNDSGVVISTVTSGNTITLPFVKVLNLA